MPGRQKKNLPIILQDILKNLRAGLMTPPAIIMLIIILIGLLLTVLRFSEGIAATSNMDDNNPWGIWIGLNLFAGVALASGGFAIAAAYYIFRLEYFKSALRPALLMSLLGYSMAIVSLIMDIDMPWRLFYPIFYQSGTTSILYKVGLCEFLCIIVLLLACAPVIAEYLGLKRLNDYLLGLGLFLAFAGVFLCILHQNSLGALFSIVPSKLHPLWNSPYLGFFFLISSAFAGISMVIFEGSLAYRWLRGQMDQAYLKNRDKIHLGLAKAAAFILICYLGLKLFDLAAGDKWTYLGSSYGIYFLSELGLFVLLPAFMYALGVREHNLALIRWAASLTVLGIIINRLNVSLVGFNSHLPANEHYFPSLEETGISLFMIIGCILAFKLAAIILPIYHEHKRSPEKELNTPS